MRLAKRTDFCVAILLILFVMICVLVLPGLPIGRASTTPSAAKSRISGSRLGGYRQASLETLYARFKSGAQFSEEEAIILEKFGAGIVLTDLEADVVVSRALFDHYILNHELTKEQQALLDRYTLSVARRPTDVADLKTQLVNKRIAAAAAAPPRATPLDAPANDLCGGAAVIPAAGPFPYLTAVTADITDATTVGDPPLPSCQNNVSRSIWYTFTPSATARYTISTCSFDGTGTTVTDPVMAIYTSAGGCGGAYTEIPTAGASDGCDDDSCVSGGLQSVITTRLTGGTQYYIVVWLYDTPPPAPGETAVQLSVSQVLPPANDTCAGAAALSLNTPINGTTAVAANDYQLSGAGCFTGVGQTPSTAPGVDVVYSFTAPAAGNYSFKVTNYDTSHNLVLYVASTCPAGAPPATVDTCLAAANRQSASPSEEVSCVPLASSQQVIVFVDEGSAGTTGSTFTIEVNLCQGETGSNDTPATANTLSCGIEGAINSGADVDFYSLGSPAAGSRLFAMIDGVAANSTDFDLRVTTSTDTLEYDDSDCDAPFGSLAPNVAGTPLTGAASFIRVDVNQLSGIATEPYRLYAVVQPPSASATAETEGNNTIGTANSAANNYFSGSLAGPAPSTDVDLFAFTANAGDLIFLSLDCDPLRDATPINGALALLDSTGTELLSVNDFRSISSTTTGAGSLTAVTPNSPAEGLVWRARSTGVYYAKVLIDPSSTGTASAGDYLLSISLNCLTGPGPCIFTLGTSSQSFASSGGADSFQLNTQGGCNWTATSNDAWIHVTSGSPGIGSGTVSYSVDSNASPDSRAGTITAGSQTFTVLQGALFSDVAQANPFFTLIGKLSARGVTVGCGFDIQGGRIYCPTNFVTREQMSAFIMRSLGEFNPVAPSSQRFNDVPPSNSFYAFIDRLAVLQITMGCSAAPPLYCPTDTVTREQMAAFLIRALGEFDPPLPPTQRFNDVPPSSLFYKFIDRMAVLNITLGCSANPPLYCPSDNVTREQMAAFLVRAFGL
jgi:hypothetical protein